MKIKIANKQIILILLVCTIIVITFFIPITFFKIQDQHLYTDNHKREPIKSKIDPQIEDVYIINAIHQLYNYENSFNYSVAASREKWLLDEAKQEAAEEKEDNDNILEELKKLEESNIISNAVLSRTTYISTYYITEKVDEKMSYHYRTFSLLGEEEMEESDRIIEANKYNITVDMKTYKVLSLQGKKEDFNIQLQEESLLRAYAMYLGLEFLEDWNYEKGQLISEKAQLAIQFKEYTIGKQQFTTLDVRPIEYLRLMDTIE